MLPFMDTPFRAFGNSLGASSDEVKLIFSFLLSYPLAGLLKRVPDARPEQKNAFVIAVSLFYFVGLFDLWNGLGTMLVSTLGTYAIAFFLRGSPYMPWVGFVFLMAHMSVGHIARQAANSPSSVDVTGAQMILVIKLSAFCWNVADGTLPEDQLSDSQLDRRLTQLPSLLDYIGYVFFFPSVFTGPAFDFVEYRRWLDCTMFEVPAQVDPSKRPPTRRKRKIPRSGTPAMLKMAAGLIWLGVFIALNKHFYKDTILEPELLELGFFRRVFVMHMINFTARTKYYAVWTLTEGACILAGLGFKGVDPETGRVSWNRLQNVDPWGVEAAQNSRGYLGGWNMNTNYWLRKYVYLRVTPRGKKPGFPASLITFTTSAFWHGFYPGYYLTFGLASFIQTVAKNFRRNLRPFFLDPKTQKPLPHKKYYDFFSWLVTQLALSFTTTPFLILSFSGSLQAWSRVYFYTIFGTAASMAFFASPAKKQLRRAIEQRATRAGVTPTNTVRDARTAEVSRTVSVVGVGSMREPVLGLSTDLGGELDEAMEEIKEGWEGRVPGLLKELDGKKEQLMRERHIGRSI